MKKLLYFLSIIFPIRDIIIGMIRGIRKEYRANTVHNMENRRKFDYDNE